MQTFHVRVKCIFLNGRTAEEVFAVEAIDQRNADQKAFDAMAKMFPMYDEMWIDLNPNR